MRGRAARISRVSALFGGADTRPFALLTYCCGRVPAANREIQFPPLFRISLNAMASPGLADCMMFARRRPRLRGGG